MADPNQLIEDEREQRAADEARLGELRRMVEDPTLHSDETLRFSIANLFGWRVDMRYYDDLRDCQDAYRARRFRARKRQ